jgi:glycerol uptake facilitator-like aquaporin
LASSISGAFFNPALSVAAFFAKKQWNQGKQLLLTLAAQIVGAFFGLFIVFLLMKNYGMIIVKP